MAESGANPRTRKSARQHDICEFLVHESKRVRVCFSRPGRRQSTPGSVRAGCRTLPIPPSGSRLYGAVPISSRLGGMRHGLLKFVTALALVALAGACGGEDPLAPP